MVPSIRERYVERFRQVIDKVLFEPVVLRYIEQRAGRVRHDLGVDQRRWQNNVAPDEAFEVIRQFIAERPGRLRAALGDPFSDATDDASETESHADDGR
jgi:hypothetical protein